MSETLNLSNPNQSKPSEIVPFVDENDRVLGYKERHELGADDIYRVVSLWILNDRDEILIAQRQSDKNHDPDAWGPSVAGTVNREDGEDYFAAILRESREELNFDFADDVQVSPMPRQSHLDYADRYFAQPFVAHAAAESYPTDAFHLQESEVQAVRWINRADLLRAAAEHPENFVSGFAESLNILNDFLNNQEEVK
jgi:isopentenyldiphosphate isomerase